MLIYLEMIEEPEHRSKFEDIYHKYRYLLYDIAYKKLHNHEDAEDAVHHAFVKIAENIKNIDPPCPKTRHFVVIVIENHIKNIFISRNRHPVCELEDEQIHDFDMEENAADLLSRCILQLPSKQRSVIWLKYHHGYSLREIADMLGISLADAQKTDHRAKAQLKKIYEENGGII